MDMNRIKSIAAPFLPQIISVLSIFHFRFSSNKNRISCINTFDQGGGAAKIALDILKRSTFKKDMTLFVNKKVTDSLQVVEIEKPLNSKFQFFLEELERIGGWLDLSKIGPLRLFKNLFFRQSNIVHLHNLHGYYFSYGILNSLARGKNVIWTLHDEQILTGHCACTLTCDLWRIGCGNCPNLGTYPAVKVDNTQNLLAFKRKVLNQLQPTIVCPSHWLASRFKIAFPFVKNVKVIANGVDTQIFSPVDKLKIREKLNLPIDSFLLLFAAELATSNPFKGGDLIHALMKEGLGESTYLITIGGNTEQISTFHIPFGYISNENEMAELYAAADLMIYPTKADNLPLVVLEAMSSGLPVLSSNIAGISEIINQGQNGFLIESCDDIIAFKNSIVNFKESSIDEKLRISRNARTTIVQNFSIVQMIDSYDELYASFLTKLK
jgi:glycosyltransferase involved in cell wall biosynthesis